MSEFLVPTFWIGLLQIVAIDLVLSGDNAVVIALACRRLQPEQRKVGIFWGVAGAVGLRVVLTAFAASLLGLAWLKLVGGLVLLWIGANLLLPEDDGAHEIDAATSVAGAVKTIIVADFVMSVDNVIGVAGAAGDSLLLLGDRAGCEYSDHRLVQPAHHEMHGALPVDRYVRGSAAGVGLRGE